MPIGSALASGFGSAGGSALGGAAGGSLLAGLGGLATGIGGLAPLLGLFGGGDPTVVPAPPPFQAGPSPGLLGGETEDIASLLRPDTPAGVTDALAQQAGAGFGSAAGSAINEDTLGIEESQSFGDRVGGFLGNIDTHLQSPSKVIGLGLLNQQDPNLALAGLLASGLFGGGRG